MLLGLLMTSVGIYTSTMLSSAIWLVTILSSSIGIGTGFISNEAVWTCADHFPNHRARSTGLLYAGFGIGPAIWSLLLFFLVNPSNIPPEVPVEVNNKTEYVFPHEVATRVPRGFQIMSLVILVVGLICIAGTFEPKHSQGTKKSYEGFCKALRSREFITIYFSSTCFFLWWMSFVGFYKSFGLIHIPEDSLLNVITSVGTVSGVFGRFVWGFGLEKWGFQKTLMSMIFLNIVFCALLHWAQASAFAYGTIVALVFFTCNGIFPVIIATIAQVFGTKLGPALYSVVSSYMLICGISFYGFVLFSDQFGYDYLWVLMISFLVTGFLFASQFGKKDMAKEEKLLELGQIK